MPVEEGLLTKLVMVLIPIQIIIFLILMVLYWLFSDSLPEITFYILLVGLPVIVATVWFASYLESLDVKRSLKDAENWK